MAFKSFERGHLELGVMMTLSALASSMVNAQTTTPAAPATVDACVALASSAERLACYDSLFKAPTIIPTQVQTDAAPVVTAAVPVVESNEPDKPESLKDKVVQKVSDLHSGAGLGPDCRHSGWFTDFSDVARGRTFG